MLQPLVTFQVILNGNLADFSPDATRSNLADELGIAAESIGLTGGRLPPSPPTVNRPYRVVALGG